VSDLYFSWTKIPTTGKQFPWTFRRLPNLRDITVDLLRACLSVRKQYGNNGIKFSRPFERVIVELKTDVSEISSVSIIRANSVNDQHVSDIYTSFVRPTPLPIGALCSRRAESNCAVTIRLWPLTVLLNLVSLLSNYILFYCFAQFERFLSI
jgi:hypothetical protein